MSNVLPSNQISNIPWRRLGVKYTNNEAYFDLIEEIDAIIDRNGSTVMCEIQGYVSERTLEFVSFRMKVFRSIVAWNWVECPIWRWSSSILVYSTMSAFIRAFDWRNGRWVRETSRRESRWRKRRFRANVFSPSSLRMEIFVWFLITSVLRSKVRLVRPWLIVHLARLAPSAFRSTSNQIFSTVKEVPVDSSWPSDRNRRWVKR